MSIQQHFRARLMSVGLAVTALLAAFGGVIAGSAPRASADVPAYCSMSWAGQVLFVWDGGGGDGQWSTAANWTNDQDPNLTHASTGYVCIPSGAAVTMGAGIQADIQAIDLQDGARLTLATGSKLYVYGDQATRPSVLRPTSSTYLSGTLGGPGRIDLLGTMWWRSTPNGASTIATRDCAARSDVRRPGGRSERPPRGG